MNDTVKISKERLEVLEDYERIVNEFKEHGFDTAKSVFQTLDEAKTMRDYYNIEHSANNRLYSKIDALQEEIRRLKSNKK